MNTEETKDKLQDLCELLEDSKKGYLKASNNATHSGLKTMLGTIAHDRAKMHADLDTELRELGVRDLKHDGTFKGSMHRAWMDIRDSFTSENNETILEECKRGEKYILDSYEDALQNEEVSSRFKTVLMRQRDAIRENLNQATKLEEAFDKVDG